MFTSGFVDWVYNDLKIEQASGFHRKNIIVVGLCSENPDGELKVTRRDDLKRVVI